MTTEGPQFSRIVPGVMRLNDWNLSTSELITWIETCLELGMTTFDHADLYGSYTCEQLFGNALREKPALRDKIELVTKCDIMMVSPNRPHIKLKYYDTSYKHIIQSVENSLRNLDTSYIDLLLIHRPDALMEPDEVAQAFTDLHLNGKVRYFGVSNFSTTQFDMLQSRLDFPLVTNQVEFSVTHMQPLYDGTFDQAIQHHFTPMAWSPLGGGSVFNANDDRIRQLRAAITQVGDELGGASLDQVMLAWILRHPANIVPIIGTGKLDRIRSAAGATKLTLTREQWYRIWMASTGHEVP
jgi:predicted oxidoreductase